MLHIDEFGNELGPLLPAPMDPMTQQQAGGGPVIKNPNSNVALVQPNPMVAGQQQLQQGQAVRGRRERKAGSFTPVQIAVVCVVFFIVVVGSCVFFASFVGDIDEENRDNEAYVQNMNEQYALQHQYVKQTYGGPCGPDTSCYYWLGAICCIGCTTLGIVGCLDCLPGDNNNCSRGSGEPRVDDEGKAIN